MYTKKGNERKGKTGYKIERLRTISTQVLRIPLKWPLPSNISYRSFIG
jgi:hypothetical protein